MRLAKKDDFGGNHEDNDTSYHGEEKGKYPKVDVRHL